MVRVKLGQATHMGKWEPYVAMVRLVRDLQDALEDAGMLMDQDRGRIDDIVHTFIRQGPKKVHDELLHG